MSSLALTMIGRYGRKTHVVDPAKGRPVCEVASAKWSANPGVMRLLNRTGPPTCHHCRHQLSR